MRKALLMLVQASTDPQTGSPATPPDPDVPPPASPAYPGYTLRPSLRCQDLQPTLYKHAMLRGLNASETTQLQGFNASYLPGGTSPNLFNGAIQALHTLRCATDTGRGAVSG